MSYYRRKFNQSVITHRPRLRRFLTKVEKNPPVLLDEYADELDREVWTEVNCLSCSNCCRVMTPTFNFEDIKRISSHLGMTIKAFKEKWLFKNKQGEWMNVNRPCQFLDRKTNMCTIYEVRPRDCAEFPHLRKKPAKKFIHLHKQNVQYCPATFKMVEKLMVKLKGVVEASGK
ncbi:MAG: YkgJ family cysteine cluster protein [Chitinophagaceae bacterium]